MTPTIIITTLLIRMMIPYLKTECSVQASIQEMSINKMKFNQKFKLSLNQEGKIRPLSFTMDIDSEKMVYDFRKAFKQNKYTGDAQHMNIPSEFNLEQVSVLTYNNR